MAPVISVIMPVFNCEPYLVKAIDSILTQSFTDFEFLICDDGSDDKSWDVICSFDDSRIIKYNNTRNKGYLWTYNFLLTKTKGAYITCQDADDWSERTRLEEQLQVFKDYPDVYLSATNGLFYYSEKIQRPCPPFSDGYLKLDEGNFCFMLPSILYKREVLAVVKGFHPYFDRLTGMDQYFILLVLSYFKGYAINRCLYIARFNPTSNHRTFDSLRKLSAPEAYYLLKRQRVDNGEDWLEQGRGDLLLAYENSLLKKRAFLAEKFREYAVYRVDSDNFRDAFSLLWKAFLKDPFSFKLYRTFWYLIRKKLGIVI